MLRQLWRWLTEVKPEPKPRVIEQFGAAGLDASAGLSILSEPKRQRLCQDIRDSLMRIAVDERRDYVDRLFLRFAFYVLDLPASESHHHSVRFGLLDHSLEVAWRVAKAVGSPVFRTTEDYAAEYGEKPVWHYAAVVCALLHDVGKVLDLEVSSPDGKDRWDPFVEPLALFCGRHRIGQTGPELWKHRVGRGMRFHAWHGPMLYPLILPPKATPYLGHRLAQLSDALIAKTLDQPPEATPDVPARIAKIIHDADVEGSKADRQSVAWPVTEPVAARKPASLDNSPAESSEADPTPALEDNEPFVIPVQCPPLDLGVVLRDFTAALRAAVERGRIPLNKEGGLYVGRKHVYLQYREGMKRVIDVMIEDGSDLVDRMEEDSAANPDRSRGEFSPEQRVFGALLAGKRLPYSSDTAAWVHQGTIVHPGGEPLEEQVVLMDIPFQEFPRFGGMLDLYGIGDPESDSARNPLAPQAEPSAPVFDRDPDEAFELRLSAELEPGRLLSTLLGALSARVFHRPGGWSLVLVRPDFAWVLFPEAFKTLFARIGIPFSGEVENRILRTLEGMPELARGSKDQVLHRIKIHPESPDLVWALAIDTAQVQVGQGGQALPAWPCPVRVVEDVPGEYAA